MTAVRVRPRPDTALPGDPERTIDPAAPDPRVVVTPSGAERAVIRPGPGAPGAPGGGSQGGGGSQNGPGEEAGSAAIGVRTAATANRPRTIEVVLDGWRFELEIEDDARAVLRRRATRDRETDAASGPTEIRAMIPGRVAAVRVRVGDAVETGQPVLVVEAMKMQNELRAPRAGTVERVAVAVGDTLELGDLLVVVR